MSISKCLWAIPHVHSRKDQSMPASLEPHTQRLPHRRLIFMVPQPLHRVSILWIRKPWNNKNQLEEKLHIHFFSWESMIVLCPSPPPLTMPQSGKKKINQKSMRFLKIYLCIWKGKLCYRGNVKPWQHIN